jgi:hypothetical protein
MAMNLLQHAGRRLLDEGGDDDELEEELEVTSGQLSSCLLLIMSILIGMTILFERVQDMMVEEAVESMKPAIKQMFAEMTILGFLSVVTYVLTSTGTLTFLSENIFCGGVHGSDDCEEGAEYLTELVEKTHYTLFFIMVVFIVEILTLVGSGNAIAKQWKVLNKYSEDANEDPSTPFPTLEVHEHKSHLSLCEPAPSAAAGDGDIDPEAAHAIMFRAMREEFINDRSKFPPFKVSGRYFVRIVV